MYCIPSFKKRWFQQDQVYWPSPISILTIHRHNLNISNGWSGFFSLHWTFIGDQMKDSLGKHHWAVEGRTSSRNGIWHVHQTKFSKIEVVINSTDRRTLNPGIRWMLMKISKVSNIHLVLKGITQHEIEHFQSGEYLLTALIIWWQSARNLVKKTDR